MTLDELIEIIRIRPGNFLGDDLDMKALYHFIQGFLYSKRTNQLACDSEYHFNELFRRFIIKKLSDINNSNRICSIKTWYEIIQLIADTNEESIKLFFTLYDKFQFMRINK
ncbi:MAG: hypothetical protein K2J47_02920 [Ruminococcus sp.]|nr:hypothetical protein [Ruminococcus sp.]